MAINVMSSKDTDEGSATHSESEKIQIMINNKADESYQRIF